MNPTLDSIATRPVEASKTEVCKQFSQPQEPRPNTIVLQPDGSLDGVNSAEFQQLLEEALESAVEAVIVDLLWVSATDTHGVASLAAGIQRATALGKKLSFQAMDRNTRTALNAEWIRQREINFGPWNDLFEANLERFLDDLTHINTHN